MFAICIQTDCLLSEQVYSKIKHLLRYSFSAVMMLVILLYPPFMKAFKLVEMDAIHWLYVLGLSITPIVVVELFKLFKINSYKDEY